MAASCNASATACASPGGGGGGGGGNGDLALKFALLGGFVALLSCVAIAVCTSIARGAERSMTHELADAVAAQLMLQHAPISRSVSGSTACSNGGDGRAEEGQGQTATLDAQAGAEALPDG